MPEIIQPVIALTSDRRRRWGTVSGLFLSVLLAGCFAHWVSYYDSASYQNLTDLKASTSILFDELIQDPTGRLARKEMASLRLEIEKAYEYEKGKEENDETVAQIASIRDLYGRMYLLLQKQGKLSPAYLQEKRDQMKAAFDLAIRTEKSKIDKKR